MGSSQCQSQHLYTGSPANTVGSLGTLAQTDIAEIIEPCELLISFMPLMAVALRSRIQAHQALLSNFLLLYALCFFFLDMLRSRGTDDRNQYALPRLYMNWL